MSNVIQFPKRPRTEGIGNVVRAAWADQNRAFLMGLADAHESIDPMQAARFRAFASGVDLGEGDE